MSFSSRSYIKKHLIFIRKDMPVSFYNVAGQKFFFEKKWQTHSPNPWHWRLQIKRLLRSSNNEDPEVSKEEGSRTSHKLFQCSTTLNSNFFLLSLTWSFPYHSHFVILSLSRGWRPHPSASSPQPSLPQAEQSWCQWPPVQAGTPDPLSRLSRPAARAKHWAWSSGRNTTANRLGMTPTCSGISKYKCLQMLWAVWPTRYATQAQQQQLHHQQHYLYWY